MVFLKHHSLTLCKCVNRYSGSDSNKVNLLGQVQNHVADFFRFDWSLLYCKVIRSHAAAGPATLAKPSLVLNKITV